MELCSRSFIQTLRDLLTEDEIQRASTQAQQLGTSLVSVLIEQQVLPARQLAEMIAQYLDLPLVDINKIKLNDIPDCISEQFINQHHILPLYLKNQQLYIAIADPAQLTLIDQLRFTVAMPIQCAVVEYDKLQRVITTWLHRCNYQVLMQSLSTDDTNDQRIIQFVQQLLNDAIQRRASDIHIEPLSTHYHIRFRVDGILQHMLDLTTELAIRVITRLKVIAKLDIAERRLPQDGRLTVDINLQQSCNCRISTCPTLQGEKIVLRLLESIKNSLTIAELGLDQLQKQILVKILTRPHGMILVTGPTGSGKTVTLYAALSYLNDLTKNILTVEDPIEIQVPTINQVHINTKIGLTFSSTLRAFLRQDPDIIMIGEIRDHETAEIAIKAAQTGHLVLSTLHTNSAAETIVRLNNMNIASFNIAYTVNLIIAQRLARKLCRHCKQQQRLSAEKLMDYGFLEQEIAQLEIYQAVGCAHCYNGYFGRVGIFEFLPIDETIIRLIMKNASTKEIAQAAQQVGMLNLQTAALDKVRKGLTDLTEVSRVVAM